MHNWGSAWPSYNNYSIDQSHLFTSVMRRGSNVKAVSSWWTSCTLQQEEKGPVCEHLLPTFHRMIPAWHLRNTHITPKDTDRLSDTGAALKCCNFKFQHFIRWPQRESKQHKMSQLFYFFQNFRPQKCSQNMCELDVRRQQRGHIIFTLVMPVKIICTVILLGGLCDAVKTPPLKLPNRIQISQLLKKCTE